MWMLFLPGVLFALIGIALLVWPPRKVNYWYGYRTPRSMRNQQTWDDANRLSGLLMLVAGFLALNAAVLCTYACGTLRSGCIVLLVVGIVLMLAVLVFTEMALNKLYDKEGNLRQR